MDASSSFHSFLSSIRRHLRLLQRNYHISYSPLTPSHSLYAQSVRITQSYTMSAAAQLPEWEPTTTAPSSKPGFFAKHKLFGSANADKVESSNANAAGAGTANPTLAQRFGNLLPPQKRYFGRFSRKTVLLSALGAFLVLLALVLGLAIGLSKTHSSSKSLPLPSNKATFTGDLTYYSPGLGACGITSSSSDSICAVSHVIFDAASTSGNPNENPLCNKKIRVTRYNSTKGKNSSADITVVDRCVGCAATDLDLSPHVFSELADESLGRVTGSWAWLD